MHVYYASWTYNINMKSTGYCNNQLKSHHLIATIELFLFWFHHFIRFSAAYILMNVAVLIGIRTGKVGEANKAPSVTCHSIGMKFSPYKQCLLLNFLLPPHWTSSHTYFIPYCVGLWFSSPGRNFSAFCIVSSPCCCTSIWSIYIILCILCCCVNGNLISHLYGCYYNMIYVNSI